MRELSVTEQRYKAVLSGRLEAGRSGYVDNDRLVFLTRMARLMRQLVRRATMRRLNTRWLLALVPVLLLLSACDAGTAADNTTPSSDAATATATTSPAVVAVVKSSPVAAPVVAPPVVAPPADPYAAATAAGATAVCADGTWSYSQHRSGTCSSHGGVHWWTGNLGAAGPGAH
jgi:uncharacterized protein DUF3761